MTFLIFYCGGKYHLKVFSHDPPENEIELFSLCHFSIFLANHKWVWTLFLCLKDVSGLGGFKIIINNHC